MDLYHQYFYPFSPTCSVYATDDMVRPLLKGLSRREEQRICNPFIEIAYNVVFKKWIVKQWSDVFMGAVFKAV